MKDLKQIAAMLAETGYKEEADAIMMMQSSLLTTRAKLFEAEKLLLERPAMNAGLFDAYSKWNGQCYLRDFLNASDDALNDLES